MDGQWFGIPAERMRASRQEVLGNQLYAEIEAHLPGLADGRQVPSRSGGIASQDGDMPFARCPLVVDDTSGLQAGLLMLVTDVTGLEIGQRPLHNEKEAAAALP